MKPTTIAALRTLRQLPDGATEQDFRANGSGSRFGGRLDDLRNEGCVIKSWKERRTWRYRLTHDPLPPISVLVAKHGVVLPPAARPSLPAGVEPVRAHTRRVQPVVVGETLFNPDAYGRAA